MRNSILRAALLATFLLSSCRASSQPTEVNLGTTIVALRTKKGVVVGADTKTSEGTMVSNRCADKISFLYQKGPVSCVVCRSGSAADTQFLTEEARWEFRSRALHYGMEEPSLDEMAKWLRYLVSNGHYSASLLCVGYDPKDGGRILSISKSGALLEEGVYASAGSGSAYIVGLMDSRMKEQVAGELMDEDEAIDFVSLLIHCAIARDQASGGDARIVVMNDQGSRRLSSQKPSSASFLRKDGARSAMKNLKGFKPAVRQEPLNQ